MLVKDASNGAPGLTTSNKVRSKDATRGSWHRYERNKKHLFLVAWHLFLLVRHLLLLAMHLFLLANTDTSLVLSNPQRRTERSVHEDLPLERALLAVRDCEIAITASGTAATGHELKGSWLMGDVPWNRWLMAFFATDFN